MFLPTDLTPADFDTRYRLEPRTWLPAIGEVCAAHGLPFKHVIPFTDGSNLIASVADEFVVKVFPPFHRNQWESEFRTLKRLWTEDISIPIPRLLASGEREDGWTYVILSKLPGVTLESVWPQLSMADKVASMQQIGRMMARVHSVPVGELHDIDPPWEPFLQQQIAHCKNRHTRLKMPEWFLQEVDEYVASKITLLPNETPVILTGEYTPFNLLAEQVDGFWRITGMIDFGDVMVGFREYDFLGPCLFLGEGNARLIDALFEAYGYASPRNDESLRSRLMVLAVLHRYSNLHAQIRIDKWSSRAHTFQDLERLIFAPAMKIE
jgi:hygromycin-B 7''-O-kinase